MRTWWYLVRTASSTRSAGVAPVRLRSLAKPQGEQRVRHRKLHLVEHAIGERVDERSLRRLHRDPAAKDGVVVQQSAIQLGATDRDLARRRRPEDLGQDLQ